MTQLRMPSPAILVAVLALVAALAGTAVAGQDASTSASVQKQLKKIKKRVKALEQQGQQPGPQGEQGPPGEDATKLFAYIRDAGSDPADTAVVHYGSGVTAVIDGNPAEPGGTNNYTVTFNRDLANCVVQAAAGLGEPPGDDFAGTFSFPFITMRGGGLVDLRFTNAAGSSVDTSFLITAFC
jgi:hypothetical protein